MSTHNIYFHGEIKYFPDTPSYLELCLFVCVEVLWPSQPIRVMSSTVSLPNTLFPGQA